MSMPRGDQKRLKSDLFILTPLPSYVLSSSPPVSQALCPPMRDQLGSSRYLLGVPLGLQVRVQPPDQGHPIPRLPLQQPVVVQPLHELVLPLQGEPTADLVQPEGSRECHGASCFADTWVS